MGSIIAVVNPRIKENEEPGRDNAISVDKDTQVWKLGTSTQFSWCKAERKDGRQCTMVVNREDCEYCEFHKTNLIKAYQRGRKEIGGGCGGGPHARLPPLPLPRESLFHPVCLSRLEFTSDAGSLHLLRRKQGGRWFELLLLVIERLRGALSGLHMCLLSYVPLSAHSRNLVQSLTRKGHNAKKGPGGYAAKREPEPTEEQLRFAPRANTAEDLNNMAQCATPPPRGLNQQRSLILILDGRRTWREALRPSWQLRLLPVRRTAPRVLLRVCLKGPLILGGKKTVFAERAQLEHY